MVYKLNKFWTLQFNEPLNVRNLLSIPHASGGDPMMINYAEYAQAYSPCEWGWSYAMSWADFKKKVFPMRVGVIPTIRHGALRYRGIPHASGGDPPIGCGTITSG